MTANDHDFIQKMQRDHDSLLRMIDRILEMCDRTGELEHCTGCDSGRRVVCGGNIEQSIRVFVETTLMHNLLESALMKDYVPHDHRVAHQRAHIELSEQLKGIRTVFAHDGNGIVAIQGIDVVRESLVRHIEEFDAVLERYLAAANPDPGDVVIAASPMTDLDIAYRPGGI
ncbi:MAG: hypothetical protein FIB06_01810 [Betaproteobacteria bacterium]|nr:hypothetical protein [Betaproteobacteria bacterium]